MELSLAGLLGAMIGSLIGAINSVAIIAYAQGRLRTRVPGEGDPHAHMAVIRRGILAANVLLCAAIGYWFGTTLGG